ncbi:MAG: 16S rRNA pseudouridine(516) synthase [Thomasclavelia spiroformis]
MLNKPKGYICANHDKKYKCVIDLIGRDDCYCLGRLDIDTTGLLLITNDKTLSKRLLLPENHIDKKYYVTVKNKLTDDLIEIFNNGIIIDQKVKCKPSYLEIIDDYHCYLTINEGRYHQIKKMFLSCNNKVLELKRVMFASINLDNNLSLANYRKLNNQEIKQLITINNTK